MSRDIRSYFSIPKKFSQKQNVIVNNESPVPIAKRKALPLSSDDEDESKSNNKLDKEKKAKKDEHKKIKSSNTNKKRRVIESDDEEVAATPPQPKKLNKKPSLHKLREIPNEKELTKDIEPFFNDVPKRVERKKLPSKKHEQISEKDLLNDDDEFEKSVINIEESELLGKIEKKSSSVQVNGSSSEQKTTPKKSSSVQVNGSSSEQKTTPKKSSKNTESSEKIKTNKSPSSEKKKKHESSSVSNDKTPKKETLKKEIKSPINNKSPKSEAKHKNSLNDVVFEESKEEKKKIHTTPKAQKTPKQKSDKESDHDTSVISDEDRHEKKRMAALLYQKFKNRQSVINHGSKEVPKGKPNCLAGLSFLVTGVLESLEREEAQNIIKELGGKVSSTVGKRLNYMIVGEDAGPKKLATAEELGIKIISEDGLFDLIRKKSGGGGENSSKKHAVKQELSPAKKEKKISPQKHKIKEIEKAVPEKKLKIESPQKISEKKVKTEETITISDMSTEQPENVENLAWVEKYKPTNTKQIIGQQGAASNVVKLRNWLSNWYSNHDGKKKLQKPNPWAKNDDGSYFKAALLSGPPGVGKTTTATLISKELGFDTVEFNASNTRSKKLLKEQVAELLSNKSLYGYCHGDNQAVTKKHVLLMDEVDGMAGNEDRGGVQELISLIKGSSIPIICMCNDRNHPKMRSLVNYCYDLRFNKPRLEQIKSPIMSICYREKIKMSAQKLEEIISATNNDIRQTINFISLMSADKKLNLNDTSSDTAKKDLKLGPWDVVRKVFSADENKRMTINEKSDLFFNDYSLGPLFVQQNYLQVMPRCPKEEIPLRVAETADSLSLGDLIEKRIRSNSAWSLLPIQAMFSSVLPGDYMAGHFTGQINFPAWLGKYSKTTKRSRLAQEIHNHTRIRTSGSRMSIRLDYAPILLDAIVRPLKEHGLDGVEKSLEVIKEYRLLREDIDSLIELSSWPGKKNPMDSVDGKVKAALTRAYNKEVLAYSYSVVSGVKKKRAEIIDEDVEYLDGEERVDGVLNEEDEDDDDLESDALIKAKKKPTTSKASNSGPSTSKKVKKDGKKTTDSSKSKGKK